MNRIFRWMMSMWKLATHENSYFQVMFRIWSDILQSLHSAYMHNVQCTKHIFLHRTIDVFCFENAMTLNVSPWCDTQLGWAQLSGKCGHGLFVFYSAYGTHNKATRIRTRTHCNGFMTVAGKTKEFRWRRNVVISTAWSTVRPRCAPQSILFF